MTEAIIDFEDFSFRYESQAEPTLKHINLKIYPGEKVVFVGHQEVVNLRFYNV